MTERSRLIEQCFPVKQTSLDSVHEKNVRHGHISTLHIWPARRPLAACRAALIATLLPDPGTPEERHEVLERLGGRVVQKIEKKKLPGGRVVEQVREETAGGILHWGRENGPDLEWFRQEIKKAYGGQPPRVLDPFAGGGAIPLEAMRLGCEVTAADINPVAWFILKCTLEYPQRLAGQKRPLPEFVLKDEAFMEQFCKANPWAGGRGRSQKAQLEFAFESDPSGEGLLPEADLAWHVRAWGRWVLERARRELARFYPTYADYQPLKPGGGVYEQRASQQVPLRDDGTPDLEALNAEFSRDHLADGRNPRWVPKPTVAYLWARTVTCKNCRATVPLLKTRWLCKKDQKRVLLTMEPDASKTGVVFGVQAEAPQAAGNAAQRRERDKKIGAGTMSRSGATCPCCGAIMTMEDIRMEGQAGRLGDVMTAVVVDGPDGKEYRLPTAGEIRFAIEAEQEIDRLWEEIPFGLPKELIVEDAKRNTWCVQYGLDEFHKLYTTRQLLALGTFVKHTRRAREAMRLEGYPLEWVETVGGYLAVCLDRLADYNSNICNWDPNGEYITHTFQRFALPVKWDFSEINPFSGATGDYAGGLEWIVRFVSYATLASGAIYAPKILEQSAVQAKDNGIDLIITDPPYYDAIGYSVLMDFFYVWLRRTLHGLSPEIDEAFREPLSPKWDRDKNDGELIDDASRHGGDRQKSKAAYEEGMFRAFQACHRALKQEGRMVIVFAHKHPDAWETLVSAIIRAGFVVNASWPIQTEMGNRTRALSSAALSSSVWLVCRKRAETARPGWDNRVLEEMRQNIYTRLREYWDAGIRGPDFVWAATGPALEAYSKYPAVKKANEPGKLMDVPEFLRAVRRLVVDFVVGRVLTHNGADTVSGLDDVTTYYLLHRHDFGLEDAPAGACILYAVSCGLSDRELADRHDILIRAGGPETDGQGDEQEDADEEEAEIAEGTGSRVRLKPWQQRKHSGLGLDAEDRPAPLIDQVHRLMRLWKAGDVTKVDDYLDQRGLRRSQLFPRVLQALIELAAAGSEERSLLESISNHVSVRGLAPAKEPELFNMQNP
ncbi:MAG: DUF1156 domain-containing protein [Peptococcaceae bacterium]|jgi:adenine-specific DNA methylase|nr:DUF1156 domain-containing protein [Peptococcaceae bacterium]MDH7525844.1 DUF1156 domain-containing protein [Peptococcaceae bacterium]